MLKLSTFIDENIGGADVDFERGIEIVKDIGIDFIDLRTIRKTSVLSCDDATLNWGKSVLDRNRVGVAHLATPLFKCPVSGTKSPSVGQSHRFRGDLTYEQNLEFLPRAMKIAEMFGQTSMRCFGFWRDWGERKFDDVFDEVVNKLGAAAEIVGRQGFELALENEMNTLVGTGRELARVLKAVNSPYLKGLYDTGNAYRLGVTDFLGEYRKLRGRLKHLHIKTEIVQILWGMQGGGQGNGTEDEFCYQPGDDRGPTVSSITPWWQPKVPVRGTLTIGDATVEIADVQTPVLLTGTIANDHRPLFRAMKADGYDGFVSHDCGVGHIVGRDGGSEDVKRRLKRIMDAIRDVIAEVWREQPATGQPVTAGTDTRH